MGEFLRGWMKLPLQAGHLWARVTDLSIILMGLFAGNKERLGSIRDANEVPIGRDREWNARARLEIGSRLIGARNVCCVSPDTHLRSRVHFAGVFSAPY